MRKRNTENSIMALSPNNRLFNEEFSPDFLEYKGFLESAFNNSSVRNIAITGNHGIGKSSILRSYESKDKKRGKGYLYISLMDFNNNRGYDDKFPKNDDNFSNEDKKRVQQEFERYLLCQILSKVDAQKLPHSTFRLIPSRRFKINFATSLLIAIFVLCVFGIVFNSVLEISSDLLKKLYYVCGAVGAILALLVTFMIGKHITTAKLSASYKGLKVEAEGQKTIASSYIDDHMFEIVYALESMAKDIGYTVVLEDMDRLGRSICIDIFSKLRRINYLVNDRKKLGNKYIRFVYAFDDSVFELTKNTKFFDYVLSVTPKLNYITAGKYFKKLILQSLPTDSEKQKEIRNIVDNYTDEFWEHTGMVVHNYRMLNHIRNDFLLFVNVMLNRELSPNQKWLPFVIYKNVLPEDYCSAFETNGVLEIEKDERNKRIQVLCEEKGDNYSQLVKLLFDYLIETMQLSGEDFHLFTGLPQKVIDIRNENYKYSNINELLKKNIQPDNELISGYVTGKNILVTGGGGSIGSELCRQIATYDIQALIIVDISENNAYEIEQEIKNKFPSINLYIEIASVQDNEQMEILFSKYRPDIVFHAAAHKHIPFMEKNPEEAIKNNIIGTYNVMRCAENNKIERFVLISTDKAANPTNVMGITKRFCELMVRSRKNSDTLFCAVRFGNVLGSNGSVIPLFKRQIENGGPVTITHKNIIRYFMTIPEVCQLILQASALTSPSQLFVLDMGEPVRILSLAESLIRMSGLEPYKDIDIVETGLRPGEKLYEELIFSEEMLSKTDKSMIYVLESDTFIDVESIDSIITRLNEAIAKHDSSNALINIIGEVVPSVSTES